MTDTVFRATNASGRAISLLNETAPIVTVPSPPSSDLSDESNPITTDRPKRKYHCSEPGCTKSFTTSGHLARHNRIHTGEKNFPCLFPGCQSRFSRQDNMMQHYRTHMSPKSSKRMPKNNSTEVRPRPRLHAHQRIRSDPYHVERPLTIDQHLNNYYRTSYTTHPPLLASKYNMPTPLGAVAAATHMQKLPQLSSSPASSPNTTTTNILPLSPPLSSPPPLLPILPVQKEEEEEEELQQQQYNGKPDLFYQHKPLSFHEESEQDSDPSSDFDLPFTLLHPSKLKENSLYQLAHIVSTFG